LKYLKCNRYSA